jgi:hypothetical protein
MLLKNKTANPPQMTSLLFSQKSVETFLQRKFSSITLEEPYVFSHGVHGGFIKMKKHGKKRRPKKKAPKHKKVNVLCRHSANRFSFRNNTIFLPHNTLPIIYPLVNKHPYNSVQRRRLIQHYRDYSVKHRVEISKSPLADLFHPEKPTYFQKLSTALIDADAEEGRLRARLRPFFHCWRLRRLSRRPLNYDDPATLSPPRIPIVLYDWSARGVWTYEAASLRDQVSAELTHVSYEFPESQAPRNPLTNKEFTYAQILSVVRQLRAAVKTNSLVEGYAELGFKIGAFQAVYWRKIRLRHFERNYRDERSEDFRREFAAFLETIVYKMIRLEHRLVYDELFHWAVYHALDEPYIQEWKGLYRQYQITEILYKDDSGYDRMIRSVYGQASILLQRKKERDALKELWMSSSFSSSESKTDADSGDMYADF